MLAFLKRYSRDRVAVVFGIILIGLYLVAIGGEWITPYDPFAIHLFDGLRPPSMQHLFGTDQFGRDILSRTILATQVTVRLTNLAVLFALFIGVPAGMIVGYHGGLLDTLVMRATDMLLIFPVILLALVIVVVTGPTEEGVIIALGISQLPQVIRVGRSVTLSVKEETYVEAAIAAGESWPMILLRHIWPNISTPIVVQATLTLPAFVLNATALSYLGLGVQPPTPEWGQMLSEGKDFLISAPYVMLGPAIALVLFVLSANLVGDAVQEALNPKMRGRLLKRAYIRSMRKVARP